MIKEGSKDGIGERFDGRLTRGGCDSRSEEGLLMRGNPASRETLLYDVGRSATEPEWQGIPIRQMDDDLFGLDVLQL